MMFTLMAYFSFLQEKQLLGSIEVF